MLFRSKKNQKKSRSPISIPNFPKIPKIILRKIADEFRDTKNTKSKFLILDYRNIDDFGNLLRGATLNYLIISVRKIDTVSVKALEFVY